MQFSPYWQRSYVNLKSSVQCSRRYRTDFVWHQCREGRSIAEEEALQEGFDHGYAEGFAWAKQVGRLRGRLAARRVKFKDSEIGLQLEKLAGEVEKLEFGKDVVELEQRLNLLK